MKNIILFIIALFYISCGLAQETVEKKNKLTDSVLERFQVLKTDKDVKEGLYKALFKRKIIVASGSYHNNTQMGIWNFYKPNGQLVQTYNFDSKRLIFESRLDTLNDFRYSIDEKFKPTDTVKIPVKIGGIYFGFIPYVAIFQLPFDTMGVNMDEFDAVIELLISPMGRLADYKVHVISFYYRYDHTFSLDVNLFSEADKQFMPLTLNGKPILSRIMIKCYVSSDGRLDYY